MGSTSSNKVTSSLKDDIIELSQKDNSLKAPHKLKAEKVIITPSRSAAPEESIDVEVEENETNDEEDYTESAISETEGLKYGASHLIMIFIPVSICMFLVTMSIICFKEIGRRDPTNGTLQVTEDKTTGGKVSNALVISLVIIGVVILMTILLVICFKCRWYTAIQIYLMIAMLSIMSLQSFNYAIEVFKFLHFWTVDMITVAILLWNYVGVGLLSIFWKAPKRLEQAYIISISALAAIAFLRIPYSEYFAWALLALLAIWDVIAVLTPCGPLRLLVESVQKDKKSFPKGLIYSAMLANISLSEAAETDSTQSESHLSTETEEIHKRRSKSSSRGLKSEKSAESEKLESDPKLGLGDFVFYSVLIGKAAIDGDANSIFACYVVILMGLALTLLLLSIFKKALPALPISICLGLIFYFTTKLLITPFCDLLSTYQAFI